MLYFKEYHQDITNTTHIVEKIFANKIADKGLTYEI
jgi:hypothetical protein